MPKPKSKQTFNSTYESTLNNEPFARGSCLLFIRYRIELDQRMRNAVVRFLGRLKQYGGSVLGFANKTTVVEAPADSGWLAHDDWCFLVLAFPAQSKARLWYISEPELKQHDFPPPSNGIDVFTVPIRYVPDSIKSTYCWFEFDHIQNKKEFTSEYVDQVRQLYDDNTIDHGLAFIKDNEDEMIDRLRDSWMKPRSHYCLSLFDSEDQFWQIHEGDSYKPLKEKRRQLCDTTCIVFTIDPRIS
ncbi:hypothetical protein LOTGIDRAFT_233581 [Lottia gigantea]|uniref:Uncharacterized protein n=1 Tax=Lottia gigantea TaxID=225164 RepID=V3ZHN5_LOTGI|nr:hypothetical protein LOTGIDRAFT_233581 [Lottia gigantea]ESO90783.1 hypothetical protein LOTGIDRAFT_233581 [Lottia gigantea]